MDSKIAIIAEEADPIIRLFFVSSTAPQTSTNTQSLQNAANRTNISIMRDLLSEDDYMSNDEEISLYEIHWWSWYKLGAVVVDEFETLSDNVEHCTMHAVGTGYASV